MKRQTWSRIYVEKKKRGVITLTIVRGGYRFFGLVSWAEEIECELELDSALILSEEVTSVTMRAYARGENR